MTQKQKKKREQEQEKKKDKKEEKEESSEEEAAEPARNSVFGLARDSGSKIVINESDESSEEQEGIDDLKTHAQKARSKMSNRTQSEVVSPVSKTKKQNTPLANHSSPATGNLIGWDPFAPNATSQPQIQPQNLAIRVHKKNKRNKTTSTPVQDPKLKQSPIPYDPFQAPLSSSNPFNGNSSFPALMPNTNNIFNSPSASAANPFGVQQSPINQSWPAVNNSLGPQSNPTQPTFFQSPVNNAFGPQSNSSPQLFFQSPSTPVNNSLAGSNQSFFTPQQQNPFNVNTSAQVNQQQQSPFNVNTSAQVNQQQLQQLQQQQLLQFQQQQLQQKQQTGFADNPFNAPQGFYGGFQSPSTQAIFGNSNF